jgi:acetyl-CoA carboxylase, biotin carboxylase subunit
VQVLADEEGQTVYLGERDCSVQRRHQKVIEEAPSPAVTSRKRSEMGEIAVRAAQAVGYTNAGTIEFLADKEGNFYFLEMNTRLQVEHPVTELVTGLDLVALQIRIASGEPLPFRQDEVQIRGHAIECRVYAEDPENNYFPSPGKITSLMEPSGPGVRLDSGVYPDWDVPMEYDPLLAKLIAYGATREQAMVRLKQALQEYAIGGIKTNLSLLRRILDDREFFSGRANTGFLTRLVEGPFKSGDGAEETVALLAAGIFRFMAEKASNSTTSTANGDTVSGWKKTARSEASQ